MLIESSQANLESVPEKNQMDKALKQRLVGASVLIILAVIILPMLLSGRSDRFKHESSRIELPPKPDELSIETRRFPVGISNRPTPDAEQGADKDTVPATPAQVEEQVVDQDQAGSNDVARMPANSVEEPMLAESEDAGSPGSVNTEAPPPAVASITLNSEKPESLEPVETTDNAEDAPRYLVQVASFSNERNANALADMLKAENHPVLLDVVDRPAGRMYRVRVGPFAKRPDADALVSSLRTKMTDLTPRVLDLRPDDSAPVSTPSDPLVRWVVQVGSFSNAKSAEELVAKLRLSGLSAFSEKVSSASGTAYKVRIGPELDRGKEAELARKVKADHQLDTFVTTQE